MKKLGFLLALALILVSTVDVKANTTNHEMGDSVRSERWLRATGISAAEKGRPSKDFIDVSSHNGTITTSEYSMMKNTYGIRGVVVKLTEGTDYQNPYAKEQVENAQAAGLKVSAYHFSHFANTTESENEAKYFLAYAKELNLSNDTTLVNDFEGTEALASSTGTADSGTFAATLKDAGYQHVVHYGAYSYFMNGTLDMSKLGEKNCWIAQWPNDPSSDNQLHTGNAAWQWASDFYFPELGDASVRPFDISSDYTGVFS